MIGQPLSGGAGGPRRLDVRILQVAYGDREDPAALVALVAAQAGTDLVLLPEPWSAGGFAFDRWSARAELLDGPFSRGMGQAARRAGAVLHAGSFVERRPPAAPGNRGLTNTAVVFDRLGGTMGVCRKAHRFGFSGGEARLLDPGDEVVTVAWPAARLEHCLTLGRPWAIENQYFVVPVKTAVSTPGVAMGGHRQVVGPDGAALGCAETAEEAVLRVVIDLDDVSRQRRDLPVLADRRLPVVAQATPVTGVMG